MKHLGTVFIVGAGPGNPDLITVRGLTCLRQADVVLHDRLIDLHLLEEAKPEAERSVPSDVAAMHESMLSSERGVTKNSGRPAAKP